jgi:hypothetical protein
MRRELGVNIVDENGAGRPTRCPCPAISHGCVQT